ncbi:hypothetical protein B0J11DRAFT_618575 [Dendryphion nanum]|uniref:Uncharacterized protein n=1 Tax=Dendryphion nanum TaxID=256645 RepID=A0A9P9IDT8_9PLEO|nr:hypothetical protein B0J11DRAFT_618575 [Dendryphion nanum]
MRRLSSNLSPQRSTFPTRHSAFSLPKASLLQTRNSAILRSLFPTAEKMDPALCNALSLLNLQNLNDLEQSFLRTDAFLRPWTEFRDSFMLMRPDGMQAPPEDKNITRMDILYFYTAFDEGEKRYDALADDCSSEYTLDENKYGIIDKSFWSAREFEKLLYVWLLQSFKVGKFRNPYGFLYFESRNPCSAWAEVFVPIVNAVRKDYNSKGRYHYGRLAKFVEGMSPSRLAFPEGNIVLPVSKNVFQSWMEKPGEGATDPITNVLLRKKKTKTVYAEDEVELRMVYPQYGQVVERPRVKVKISTWIQQQRAKLAHKKALKGLEGSSSSWSLQLSPSVRHSPPNKAKASPVPRRWMSDASPRHGKWKDMHSPDGSAIPMSPLKLEYVVDHQNTEVDEAAVNKVNSSHHARMISLDSNRPNLITVTTKPSPLDDIMLHRRMLSKESIRPRVLEKLSAHSVECSLRSSNNSGQSQHMICPAGQQQQANQAEEWQRNLIHPALRQEQSMRPSDTSPTQDRYGTDEHEHRLNVFRCENTTQKVQIEAPSGLDLPSYDNSFAQQYAEMKKEKATSTVNDWFHMPSYEGNGYGSDVSLPRVHETRPSSDGIGHGSKIHETRPTYEGNGYGSNISLPTVHENQLNYNNNEWSSEVSLLTIYETQPRYQASGFSSDISLPTVHEVPPIKRIQRSRIPSPVQAAPTMEKSRKYHPIVEQEISRADNAPIVAGPAPSIPRKNPNRCYASHARDPGSRSNYLSAEEPGDHLPVRIISKQNIRAALGRISRETSAESLKQNADDDQVPEPTTSSPMSDGSLYHAFAGIGGRGINTGEVAPTHVAPKGAFNTHMFPRLGSPAQGSVAKRRYDAGGQYEMTELGGSKNGR